MSAASGSPTSRPRSAPLASTPVSSPASARRRGPAPATSAVLSPLSTLAGSPSPHPYRAPSLRSPTESVSAQSSSWLNLAPSSNRYRSFSAAASHAGSLATTTATTANHTRFNRSHARARPGQSPSSQAASSPAAAAAVSAVAKSANPDDVDLLALDDPDQIFRAFGVRDVRKIEHRASEAAAAKVAELRSMVGERYRDLLSAADSIVRMRNAADKLVDRLESVQNSLSHVAGSPSDASPTKRQSLLRSARQLGAPEEHDDDQNDLWSSTTVAHALQVLLAIPSLVHAKLDASDFLGAARLKDLGQVVYRTLSDATVTRPDLPRRGDDDGHAAAPAGTQKRLVEVFPLIEKQAEPLAALGPLISKRALVALHDWESEPAVLAQTLAAVVMLRHVDAAAGLSTFLEARSRALEELLQSPASTSQPQPQPPTATDTTAIVAAERLFGVLALVLRTVEAAYAVFSDDASVQQQDSLCGLLCELERQPTSPESAAGAGTEAGGASVLPALLSAFPNAPVLQRHLPLSILKHRPSVSTAPCSQSAVSAAIEHWTATATKLILAGFSAWISSLSEAKALADLRETGRRALRATGHSATAASTASSATSTATAHELQRNLERAIEARLAEVYRARLAALVTRVRPSIETLLLALPESAADADAATFLFDTPLAFPSASSYAPTSSAASFPRRSGFNSASATLHAAGEAAAAIDPFESFLAKVGKRVDGRSPLLDKGVTELEAAARAIRVDLDSWLGAGSLSSSEKEEEEEEEEGDVRLRERLRDEYVVAAGDALVGVANAIGQVVQEVQNDLNGSLFLGNLVFVLSTSPTFAADLLLADSVSSGSSVLETWQQQLRVVQQTSLVTWRTRTVEKACARLRDSLDLAAAQSPEATLWAWETSRKGVDQPNGSEPVPTPAAPSNATLSALTMLKTAVQQVGLHRIDTDPAIAASLVDAFVTEAARMATDFADVVERAADGLSGNLKREIATRVAWDLTLLIKLTTELPAGILLLRQRFERMASSSENGAIGETLEASVLEYLRRTQSVFHTLIPRALVESAALATESAEQSGIKTKSSPAINHLLPLGPALSAFSAIGDLHGAAAGLVKPGPRLGLLPTRG
ncbi:hypothetical protein JCM3774_004855 [Rhodotorula dairenensis]